MSGSRGVVDNLDASTGAGGSHGGPVGPQETLNTLFFVIGVLENIERDRIRLVQKSQCDLLTARFENTDDEALVMISIRAAQFTDH